MKSIWSDNHHSSSKRNCYRHMHQEAHLLIDLGRQCKSNVLILVPADWRKTVRRLSTELHRWSKKAKSFRWNDAWERECLQLLQQNDLKEPWNSQNMVRLVGRSIWSRQSVKLWFKWRNCTKMTPIIFQVLTVQWIIGKLLGLARGVCVGFGIWTANPNPTPGWILCYRFPAGLLTYIMVRHVWVITRTPSFEKETKAIRESCKLFSITTKHVTGLQLRILSACHVWQ